MAIGKSLASVGMRVSVTTISSIPERASVSAYARGVGGQKGRPGLEDDVACNPSTLGAPRIFCAGVDGGT